MPFWKKINTEIVHQNPFWIYRRTTFAVPDSEQNSDYWHVETPGSVLVVPILSDGRLGLIRTYRCLFDRHSMEFPGGAVEVGQSFEQAARAELQQEVGLAAKELINVAEFCPFNGITTEVCHVFLARGLSQVAAENNPQEIIELTPRRLDEIEDLICRNEIWDGETLAAWAILRPLLCRNVLP